MKKLFVMIIVVMMLFTACGNNDIEESTPAESSTYSDDDGVETNVDEVASETTSDDCVNSTVETDSTVSVDDANESDASAEANTDEVAEDGADEAHTDKIDPPQTGETNDVVVEKTEPVKDNDNKADNTQNDDVVFDKVRETVYATSNVNIRKGPGTNFDRIGQLSKDQDVIRVGIGSNGWSKIIYNGEEAYVNSKYLTTDKPANNDEEPEHNNKNEDFVAETNPGASTDNEDSPSMSPAGPENNNEKQPSNNENNNETSDREQEPNSGENMQTGPSDNDGSYAGDTAVPPDVNEDKPHVCEEHKMELTQTKIDASYELCNYVTDYYKCVNCGHSTSEVHMASANASNATIVNAERTVAAYANKLRKDNGLSELWTNPAWDAWADVRAKELATLYAHSRPNGSSWTHAEGNTYTIGENIAAGKTAGIDFYIAFANSAQHRNLMLDENAVGLAVGIYVDENGRTYCAMIVFANY